MKQLFISLLIVITLWLFMVGAIICIVRESIIKNSKQPPPKTVTHEIYGDYDTISEGCENSYQIFGDSIKIDHDTIILGKRRIILVNKKEN